MLKRLLSFLLVLSLCLSLAGCMDDYEGSFEEEEEPELFEEEKQEDEEYGEIGFSGDPEQTWAIYWYLCGSDLESEYGAATA